MKGRGGGQAALVSLPPLSGLLAKLSGLLGCCGRALCEVAAHSGGSSSAGDGDSGGGGNDGGASGGGDDDDDDGDGDGVLEGQHAKTVCSLADLRWGWAGVGASDGGAWCDKLPLMFLFE